MSRYIARSVQNQGDLGSRASSTSSSLCISRSLSRFAALFFCHSSHSSSESPRFSPFALSNSSAYSLGVNLVESGRSTVLSSPGKRIKGSKFMSTIFCAVSFHFRSKRFVLYKIERGSSPSNILVFIFPVDQRRSYNAFGAPLGGNRRSPTNFRLSLSSREDPSLFLEGILPDWSETDSLGEVRLYEPTAKWNSNPFLESGVSSEPRYISKNVDTLGT